MKRVLQIVLILLVFQSSAQVNQDVFIQVIGKAISDKDSAAVVGATVQYEKLPYFDDMGIAKSNENGRFEFYLIKGLKYNFAFKKAGFETLQKEVEIVDQVDGSQYLDFFMKEIVKPVEPEPEPEPEPEHFTIENLIFSRGSAVIAPSSYAGLDELAEFIKARPSMVIQLEGHTDFDGNADANMKLSQARVESVKEYLLDKGVKKDKVLTKAFGGSQPLSTERTDEAKERNRRVEVSVISR